MVVVLLILGLWIFGGLNDLEPFPIFSYISVCKFIFPLLPRLSLSHNKASKTSTNQKYFTGLVRLRRMDICDKDKVRNTSLFQHFQLSFDFRIWLFLALLIKVIVQSNITHTFTLFQIGVCTLPHRPNETYLYEVKVNTGSRKGAGTESKVFVVLTGMN